MHRLKNRRSPSPLRATWRAAAAIVVLTCACRARAPHHTDTPKLETALDLQPGDTPPAKPPAPSPPDPPAAKSLPDGSPGLLVINDSERDIDIYAAYIVDRAGELGTRVLWPHKRDCEGRTHLTHVVPMRGGRFTLAPPSRTFAPGECEAGPPLPPGDYIVSIDSGYGSRLHASAPVSLPMTAPVELRIERKDAPLPCTEELARRAVNLLRGRLERSPASRARLPPGFLDGCDLSRPRCVERDEPPTLPPARCGATLFTGEHHSRLRVLKPAGDDALRGLSMEFDHDVVRGREPAVTRASSASFKVGDAELVIAGDSTEYWHVHGGDASRIGQLELRVHNPLSRPVKLQVVALEWLRSFSCELPNEPGARPVIRERHPKGPLPPGESTLTIVFEPQEAYQGHCDRFATRVRVVVGGVERSITGEHLVGRFDPPE